MRASLRLQGTAKMRASQLKFIESALKSASKKPGWTIGERVTHS